MYFCYAEQNLTYTTHQQLIVLCVYARTRRKTRGKNFFYYQTEAAIYLILRMCTGVHIFGDAKNFAQI